jgi:hypothetical protein
MPSDSQMSNITKGLRIGAVTAVISLIGTLLGILFGDPLLWSASGGVIGAMIGWLFFGRNERGSWKSIFTSMPIDGAMVRDPSHADLELSQSASQNFTASTESMSSGQPAKRRHLQPTK